MKTHLELINVEPIDDREFEADLEIHYEGGKVKNLQQKIYFEDFGEWMHHNGIIAEQENGLDDIFKYQNGITRTVKEDAWKHIELYLSEYFNIDLIQSLSKKNNSLTGISASLDNQIEELRAMRTKQAKQLGDLGEMRFAVEALVSEVKKSWPQGGINWELEYAKTMQELERITHRFRADNVMKVINVGS